LAPAERNDVGWVEPTRQYRPKSEPESSTAEFIVLELPRVTATTPGIAGHLYSEALHGRNIPQPVQVQIAPQSAASGSETREPGERPPYAALVVYVRE
jgi:hypothetical protein